MTTKSRHTNPTDAGPLLDRTGNIDPTYVPDFAACVLPYCTWYQSDFLGGVRGMKALEIGVYSMLLNEMYERGEALDMPLDRLARLCGTTKGTLSKALEVLIEEEKIIRLECGLWNVKVQKVFMVRKKTSTANSSAGKSSAEKRNEINGSHARALNGGSADVQPSPEVQSTDNNNSKDKSLSLLSTSAARNDDDYSKFLEAHPSPRETMRGETLFQNAVGEGVPADELIGAAKRYATISADYDRDKIKFSDNWLEARAWEKYPAGSEKAQASDDEIQGFWARKIKSGKAYGLSDKMAHECIGAELVTIDEVRCVLGERWE